MATSAKKLVLVVKHCTGYTLKNWKIQRTYITGLWLEELGVVVGCNALELVYKTGGSGQSMLPAIYYYREDYTLPDIWKSVKSVTVEDGIYTQLANYVETFSNGVELGKKLNLEITHIL